MANFRYYHYLFILVAASGLFYGCATIINGSTQEVSFSFPPGTQMFDESGAALPMVYYGENNATLKLKRKKDYSFRFVLNGHETLRKVESSFEGGWIIPDLFFYGFIVDAITGAWHSFDDRFVIRFPNDTTKHPGFTSSVIEYVITPEPPKIGGVITGNLGLVFPAGSSSNSYTILLPFCYGVGLGYEYTSRLTFLLSAEGGNDIDILPKYSRYEFLSDYATYNLGVRFRIEDNIYLTGGAGLTHVTSDSLYYNRYGYDSLGRRVDLSIVTAPTDKLMPSVFAGIGIAGSVGFFELRHTFGLSKINLFNGENGSFETTSITFGLNLKF